MLYYLLAISAGFAGVLQSGLNRRIADKTGLALALHIGNLVVLIGGILVLTLVPYVTRGHFKKLVEFKVRPVTELFEWWYLVPGLCGLLFIVVAPLAISRIGALKVIVGMICAQVVGGFLWDRYVEGMPTDVWRITACALTAAGAGALTFSRA